MLVKRSVNINIELFQIKTTYLVKVIWMKHPCMTRMKAESWVQLMNGLLRALVALKKVEYPEGLM